MKTGICKVCGSDKTSPTMIGGSKFKRCKACGQMDMMQTNADRIRSMSDEELAGFIWLELPVHVLQQDKSLGHIKDWLQQEVE